MKITHLIAYEIGVHIGDGNMYSYNRTHRITYSGNLQNEKEFYKLLARIIKKIYNVKPILIERKKDNTILLIINSKKLIQWKVKEFNLPIGSKKDIEIPEKILKDSKLTCFFMRGLGDTDFSLSFKKNKKGIHTEPRLEMYTASQKLATQISYILKKFNFTFSLQKLGRGFMIRIYGKRNLKKWLKTFGFNNPWIKLKIKVWKKLGYYPIGKTYEELKEILKASPSG